jgi:uncharacterized protein YjbI with pentapeptide repeats
LSGADLSKAHLSGAKLTNTHLSGADLSGASYNLETIFSDGLDPAEFKMIITL